MALTAADKEFIEALIAEALTSKPKASAKASSHKPSEKTIGVPCCGKLFAYESGAKWHIANFRHA